MGNNFEFQGVSNRVDVDEVKGGRWTWTVFIDALHRDRCLDRPLPSEDIALSEAKNQAEWIIKNMNRPA